MSIRIEYNNCLKFVEESEIKAMTQKSVAHLESLLDGKGQGNDFLGWLTLPEDILPEIDRINEISTILRESADTTIVIGIGGSYLGSKAILEALNIPFDENKNRHRIVFAGHHLSEDYHASLLNYLKHKVFNIIVISKSGTTTEPAIAFRLFKNLLEENLGKEEAVKHIVAITDKNRGALRTLSNQMGYETFSIPENVGGRFSVLSPVGLLPVATAGYNISDIITGALAMTRLTRDNTDINSNPALLYASLRNVLYNKGYGIEMLVNYEPSLHYVAEWWKQLFGESEGKQRKGIFPSSADLTSDLHSLGQYIQDGKRFLFETVISIDKSHQSLLIPDSVDNLDKLNFVSGKRISEVNHKAEEGTVMAHVDGGVPNIRLVVPSLNEEWLGQLLYFFEISCAISGYELGVNPFDQPGVEAYKKNMFHLLGK